MTVRGWRRTTVIRNTCAKKGEGIHKLTQRSQTPPLFHKDQRNGWYYVTRISYAHKRTPVELLKRTTTREGGGIAIVMLHHSIKK